MQDHRPHLGVRWPDAGPRVNIKWQYTFYSPRSLNIVSIIKASILLNLLMVLFLSQSSFLSYPFLGKNKTGLELRLMYLEGVACFCRLKSLPVAGVDQWPRVSPLQPWHVTRALVTMISDPCFARTKWWLSGISSLSIHLAPQHLSPHTQRFCSRYGHFLEKWK